MAFHGVSKAFPGGVTALDGIDLTLARGEFCVVLGPSGSGKTTLLRAAIGLADTDAGQICIDGLLLARRSLREIRRRIAMVHQDFGLVDRLTAAQNVMAGAAAGTGALRVLVQHYRPEIRAKAAMLLDRVGLNEHQANRRARDLSGGQRQRVGIARALINDPIAVLADEPVASLDPAAARDVLALLREAAGERGAAVLCSLHQIDLARAYADRIVAVSAGQIVFDGPPSALLPAVVSQIYGASGNVSHLSAVGG